MRIPKKYWLVPTVHVLMMLFGALIVLSQGSAVAPYIYPVVRRAFQDLR